jgi:hypothetical protein
MENEKPETEILFPEIEVMGIKVRPWSYAQMVSLLPWCLKIMNHFKQSGVSYENISTLAEKSQEKMDEIMGLLSFALPLVPELIERTTGEKNSETWPFDRTLTIGLVIVTQNAQRLKNLFGLATTMKDSMGIG